LIPNSLDEFRAIAAKSFASIRSQPRPPTAINIPPNNLGVYLAARSDRPKTQPYKRIPSDRWF